jgi:hypothetical protein
VRLNLFSCFTFDVRLEIFDKIWQSKIPFLSFLFSFTKRRGTSTKNVGQILLIFPKTTQRRDHTSLLFIAVGVVCLLLQLMLLLWWLVVGLGVLPVPGAVVEGGVEVHRASVRGGEPGDLLEHVLSG